MSDESWCWITCVTVLRRLCLLELSEVRNQAIVCFFLKSIFYSLMLLLLFFTFTIPMRIKSSLEKQTFFSYLPKPDSIETLGELLGPKYLLGDFGQFYNGQLALTNQKEQFNGHRVWWAPWAQTWVSWLLLIILNLTWRAPHGPKYSLAGASNPNPIRDSRVPQSPFEAVNWKLSAERYVRLSMCPKPPWILQNTFRAEP